MSVLKLADAKAHLNTSQSVNDGELQAIIDAAEAAIVGKVGPLTPTTATERIRGGVTALVLRNSPVISLTSITPTPLGPTVQISDLFLDTETGIITHIWGWPFYAFAYDLVYQVGRSTVPDDLLLAIKELVRHLWSAQNGPVRTGPLQSDSLSNSLPGSAYTFPIRVTELLSPYLQHGIA